MKTKKLTLVTLTVIIFSFLVGNSILLGDAGNSQEKVTKKEKKEKKSEKKKKKKKLKSFHYEMTVTATRTKRDTFEIAKPISVISRKKIEEKAANNVADLLVEEPGVDISGVGATQSKPVIRGERGSRILLKADGIRIYSSRFDPEMGGESTSLVDMQELDRVEVVRGPSSVLYGSDAIGGVINLITRLPEYDINKPTFRGNLSYAYSSMGLNKGSLNFFASTGRLGIRFSGNKRNVEDYTAPAGTFGNIVMDNDNIVNDTGIEDYGLNFHLNYKLTDTSNFSFKYSKYNGKNGGFGSVDAAEYGGDTSFSMDVLYPLISNDKYTVKYENTNLGLFLADYLSFTTYMIKNERQVDQNMNMSFFMYGMPMYMKTAFETVTNVNTTGLRLELNKAAKNHLFTYGVDYSVEKSDSTKVSSTEMKMFGPPRVTISNAPSMADASYTTYGMFIQDDISLFSRASLIFGVRYQNNKAESLTTPNLDDLVPTTFTDQAIVGAANLVIGITDELKFVLSMGQGFRSPNLVDRYYSGIIGGGIFVANPDLKAEKSFNIDVGFKYRNRNFYFEGTYFNNNLTDGIAMKSIGDNEQGIEMIQRENYAKILKNGFEVMGKYYFVFGLSLSANYSTMKAKNLSDDKDEYDFASTFSSKVNFNVRYEHPGKFFWMGYDLRISGDQKDSLITDNVIGDFIPGYTVHSIYAGITLFRNGRFPQRVSLVINNLTNVLYAEFSNSQMFRPAPKRSVSLNWSTSF